jgi:hypothetical protein
VLSDRTCRRVVPQDPREGGVAYDVTVEVESDPSVTVDVGGLSGPGWMLWSDGALNVPVTLPPDDVSIELLQAGAALPPAEPWSSMPNVGTW